jgi:pimeloyl-ACP methyl ester carboxylesterase
MAGVASISASVTAARPAGWTDVALTRIGRALDGAMLTGMRLAFSNTLRPADDGPALAESPLPYLDERLRREPRRFFAFLDDDRPPTAPRLLERRDIAGGEIAVCEFPTCYTPWHPSAAWPACDENARVPIQHWRHRDRAPRATAIALHGFTMGHAWLDARILMAAEWFERGFDVVLPALPFHGPRAPRDARYSGEAFASWDVRRLNEAVRQAVHDVDLVRRWLVAESRAPVGLLGLSLGGYVTALMAALRSDLAFAVPVAAPVTLGWLPRRLFGFGAHDRHSIPIRSRLLASAYRVHSPLAHPLAIPRERTFIVGGLGDRVVPPKQVLALWRHWGKPETHWFTGGHATPFGRTRIIARIEAHLRRLL